MKVVIKFSAFRQDVPRANTPIELPAGADVAALLKAIGAKWGKELKDVWNEETQEFKITVLIASQGRMLAKEEKLRDGQILRIIGQIGG